MFGPSSPFVGLQLDPVSTGSSDFSQLCDEILDRAPVNTLIPFFEETTVRQSLPANIADRFFGPTQPHLDDSGHDWIDRLSKATAKRDMHLYLGGGESHWCIGPEGFVNDGAARQIDCFGNPGRMTCVNRPAWIEYQMHLHAAIFEAHPEVSGFLFMHERSGPMQQLTSPDPWQGEFNPICFCADCEALGRRRGIAVERARLGMRKLVELLRDQPRHLTRDGMFVGFWRALLEYPEVLAWEKLQWDSLHEYRKRIAAAIREARPGVRIGYHFQHCTMNANFPWRAGDDPTRARDFADFVKGSIYPAVSGFRYRKALDRARATWLGDFDDETAHRAFCAWFGRSENEGREVLAEGAPSDLQVAYSPQWVETEVRRVTEACAPLPHYAGLGIGIPGGEKADTPELAAASTEACLRGGAKGFLLSRHYHEMNEACLRAAGDVIRGNWAALEETAMA